MFISQTTKERQNIEAALRLDVSPEVLVRLVASRIVGHRPGVSVVYCRECGVRNDLGWRTCPVCGTSSEPEAAPEAKPETQIAPLSPRPSEPHPVVVPRAVRMWQFRIAGVLIAAGVVTTVVALFPPYYLNGKSLAGDPGNLWFNIPTLTAWVLGGGLLMRSATRSLGAGIAVGATLVDLAFQLPDVSSVIAGDNLAGRGFVLGNVGSGLCSLGSLVALVAVRRRTDAKGRKGLPWAPWMYICGGLFALQLVSHSITESRFLSRGTFTSTGGPTYTTYTTTCCSAFRHRSSYDIAGTIVLLVLSIALPIIATRVRHRSVGIGFFIGAGISLASNWAYWVAYLTTTKVTPALFGYTDAQVTQYGVSLSMHPAFGYWVGAAAAIALLIAAIKGASWLSANNQQSKQPTSHVGPTPGTARGPWAIGTGIFALVLVAVGAPAAGNKTYSTGDATTAASVLPAGSGTSSGSGPGPGGGIPAAPGLSATARCRDGTLSYSAHHQGTCSHHGGVSVWLDGVASTSTPPPTAPTSTPVVIVPAPATPTTVAVAPTTPPTSPPATSRTAAAFSPVAPASLVSAALTVIPCRTSFGVDESPPPPLPPTVTVKVPAGQVSQLAVYSDTNGLMQLVGPRGWLCDAFYGADGGGGVEAYPAGALASSGDLLPNAQAIVGNETSACVGCMEEQACPLFAIAAADYLRDYQADCPRARPAAEAFFRISDGVVAFEDPPGVKGSARPSGGINPANGVMTYYSGSPSGSWAETCTLPESEHALCTTTLNAFVSAYGTQ